MSQPITGTPAEIAKQLLTLRSLGIAEVRVDLTDKSPAAVEAMAPVVAIVHAGGH